MRWHFSQHLQVQFCTFPNPSSVAPFSLALPLFEAPSHPFSNLSITPVPQSLSYSFHADEFRYPLNAVFCRSSLKLVSVVAASTSSSHHRWFRCDSKSLEDALIKRVMVTTEEVITRTLDHVASVGSRDALAKF
ncbi:hypothetical protein AHAS_Ahas09G0137500 [Arachis hypogaea]